MGSVVGLLFCGADCCRRRLVVPSVLLRTSAQTAVGVELLLVSWCSNDGVEEA